MGERGETEADPPMDEVAKRLDFNSPGARSRERRKNNSHSSSPSQAAKVRDPLHGQHRLQGKKRGSRRKGRKFGVGLMAALVVWLMCLACLGVMAWLNWDRWSELSMKGTES